MGFEIDVASSFGGVTDDIRHRCHTGCLYDRFSHSEELYKRQIRYIGIREKIEGLGLPSRHIVVCLAHR